MYCPMTSDADLKVSESPKNSEGTSRPPGSPAGPEVSPDILAIQRRLKEKHPLDLYGIYRDYLKHEDNLMNWRITWFLSTQAFLFGGYALLIKDRFKSTSFAGLFKVFFAPYEQLQIPGFSSLESIFVCVLIFFGFVAAHRSAQSIQAAMHAIEFLEWRWRCVVMAQEDSKRPTAVSRTLWSELKALGGEFVFWRKDKSIPEPEVGILPGLTGGGFGRATAQGLTSAIFLPLAARSVWVLILLFHLILMCGHLRILFKW